MSPVRRVGILVLLVVLAAVAVRLGFWQLDRLAQRRAENRVALAARELPVLELSGVAPGDSQVVGRRVSARGRFLPDGELRLRNRVHREAPGVHVVTPFRLDESGGAVLWVLRGFVHAADGVNPPAIPAPVAGEVTLRGVMAGFPVTDDGGRPVAVAGDTTWQRLDSAMVAARRPGALAGYLYLEGGEDGPGRLPAVAPPALDEGPHLSYALQWFGIAAAILGFGVIVLRRGGRSSAPPPAAP